jgi:hypothetical protein
MRVMWHISFAGAAILLLLGGASETSAQTLIRGALLDERSNAPITAGRITLLNDRKRIVMSDETDALGYFELWAEDPGQYILRSQRLGYLNTSTPPMDLVTGDTLNIEFRISPDAVYLAPVTVTASALRWWERTEPAALWSFYERREMYERMGMGRFMIREDLEPFDGMSVTQYLQTVPGIRLATISTDLREVSYPTLRAQAGLLRPCQPDFYVDGARVRFRSPLDPDFGPSDTIDAILEVPQIVGVEVYDGVAILPGEFGGTTANCGVIAIWTSRQG